MAGEVERLQELVDKYDNIVFFGGAGVSTESGIPDFRSQDGLYHQKYDYPPETILSHTFFMRKPEEFFKFYRDKMLCDTAKPNAAHLKLAELEQAGKLKAVITQNIDNLHQMAGSKKVLELHGSVYRNYCMKCHRFYDFAHMKASTGVPRCECGGIIKPDVVLYEEGLDNQTINEAVKAISEAQVLIIGGTSLAVYPAAGLIDYFRGEHLVVINKSPTPRDRYADLLIQGPIGQVFSQPKRSRWISWSRIRIRRFLLPGIQVSIVMTSMGHCPMIILLCIWVRTVLLIISVLQTAVSVIFSVKCI